MNARALVDRLAASPAVPMAGAAITLAIGLVFIFVWAPHPWGWQGIDQYHQIAIELAQGRPFETFDVPWGYGYFLAPFYWLFGPTPLPALLVQALLNATVPLMVYAYTVRAFDRRIAAVATLLVAGLSFNTVYVSTESTDSVSTTLFMAALLAFARGREENRWRWFIAAGLCTGIAAQFRPNLVLLPLVFAGLNWLLGPWTWRRIQQGVVIAVVAFALLVPWTWRNYQLSGQFLPTSTHGGVQLWYGTLQAGPYIESRAHNPRSVFATSPFDYTSLVGVPVDFNVSMNCGQTVPESVHLVYRLDRGPLNRIAMTPVAGNRYAGSIPPVGREARIYHHVEAEWPADVAAAPSLTPAGGDADPFVYFVSNRHTENLDVDDVLLDLFDVVGMVRHLAWAEPVSAQAKLDANHDGRLDESDLRAALRKMLRGLDRGEPSIDRLRAITLSDTSATLRFVDESRLVVPRQWNGEYTDLTVDLGIAEALFAGRYRFTQPDPEPRVPQETECLRAGEILINRAYYRVQPHEQQRYMALALDNIRRGPIDYAWSVLYRSIRLFIIIGTDDLGTAQQFANSRLVYGAGTLLSSFYLALAIIGAWIGWKRGYAVLLPLALILYIPATISFVLTNMRYTTTVQPLLLILVAVTLVAVADRLSPAVRPR
ncbi:MAG TPA: glycosyltransferase family 39 protein [Vicinamibacterales bacterium]|nr:glycosyltransferase family 39 protein [Vicinamibacterales bacterium]